MKKLIIFIILADIFTKYWSYKIQPNINILWDLLTFTYAKNTWIAFGIELPGIAFIIPIILAFLIGFLIKSWRGISEKEKIAYVLIITGWILNAWERAIFGSVTDFIHLAYFAIFNIADIAISIWFITLILPSKKNKNQK